MPEPNIKQALEFLARFREGGPWSLTAIRPDKKKIQTETFTELGQVEAWLNERVHSFNIYFNVNTLISNVSKKASREDVATLDWIHVDIDPRAGVDINEERSYALEKLTDKLPRGVPEPTVIIFSGGGYQAFWKLKTPVEIDGNLEAAEDAKLYNLYIETIFDADHCHNIDRIMRLPGTLNLPDAKKQAAGRKTELAKLLEFNNNEYEVSAFKKQPKQQGTGAGNTKTAKLQGEIPEIYDVNYLDQWDVPDRVKVAIVQGRHPDEPKAGDNSRSAWLFDVCCSLIRSNVPDEVIFAVITNKEFAISDSVLEIGNSEKYALRQIERAREYSVDPLLMELNEKHAVIGNTGGACRIIEELYDEALGRWRVTWSGFGDFHHRYESKKVIIGEDKDGNPKYMELGKWWTKHPERRQYTQVVFNPERGYDSGENYNLWQGFSVQPKPGDWGVLRDHIWRNICNRNEEHFNYLMGWMARLVQHPELQGEVAIVLKGGRGVGKSILANLIGKLFGRHYMHISNASHLIGNFNAHLRDTCFLFADEAFFAGDKKHESVLKTIITEKHMQIEAKGVDVQTQPNYIKLMMASNNDWVIPAGPDERRFCVFQVGEENKQDRSFFKGLMEQMNNGGLEAFLYDLDNYDLEDFDVTRVPQTEALRDQKRRSLGVVEEWWYRNLVNGTILTDHERWEKTIPTKLVQDDFNKYVNDWGARRYANINETTFGKGIRDVVQVKRTQKTVDLAELDYDGRETVTRKRTHVYQFPPLAECRKQWEKRYGDEDWEQAEQQFDKEQKTIPF